jgi:hypothetical protein
MRRAEARLGLEERLGLSGANPNDLFPPAVAGVSIGAIPTTDWQRGDLMVKSSGGTGYSQTWIAFSEAPYMYRPSLTRPRMDSL